MKELDLRLFDATTYTVTVYTDAGITSATADPASGAEETEVELAITPATGYEVAEIQVISGGVTVDPETLKFEIGEANVVLMVHSKANNLYKVLEPCTINVNGVRQHFQRNVTVVLAPNGAIEDVTCSGTAITMNAAVQQLIDQGILVKI